MSSGVKDRDFCLVVGLEIQLKLYAETIRFRTFSLLDRLDRHPGQRYRHS